MAYFIIIKLFIQNLCFFTETKLFRFNCYFKHLFIQHLQQVLEQSSYKVELYTLKYFNKYCKYYQKQKKSPDKFKFIIKNDIDFNYNIIVDILYIESKLKLHIIDKTTCF